MTKLNRHIGTIATAIVLALSASSAQALDKIARFKANRLDGTKFKLAAELTNKPILFHFWDTCCPDCRLALPAVDSASQVLKEEIRLVTVSIDGPKTQSKIKPFLAAQRYSHEVLLDPNLEIRKLFGGTETPFSALVLPDGTVAFRRTGSSPAEYQELITAIKASLANLNGNQSTSTESP